MFQPTIESLRRIVLLFVPSYAILYFMFIHLEEGAMDGVRSIINLTGTTFAAVIMWLARSHWGGHDKTTRRIWFCFWLGILLVLLGDVTWFGLQHILGIEVGIPSPADFFFSSGYLIWLYALYCYILSKKNREGRVIVFDVLITMLVLGVVIVKYINMPVPNEEEMSLLAKVVNLIYPLADCFYLIGLLVLFFVSDQIKHFWRECLFIFIAFALFFAADQSFILFANAFTMADYFFDPFWPLGRIFIATASLFVITPKSNQKLEAQKTAVMKDGWYYFQVGAPYVFTVLIILTISPGYIVHTPLFLGVNIIVTLIIGRQLSMLGENRALMKKLAESNAVLEENRVLLEKQNERLRTMTNLKEEEAATDFLTGLKNRRHIQETLDSLGQTSGATVNVGLMLIDVDHFKPINDTYGHQTGDDILCLVAKAITGVARGTDIAGRFGGDEFILILPGADTQTLEKVAQRLLDAIHSTPMPHPDIRLGLSIGAAAWFSQRADYKKEDLLLRADEALYEVKARGRNGFQIAKR